MGRTLGGYSPADLEAILIQNGFFEDVKRIKKESLKKYQGESKNMRNKRAHYQSEEFTKLCQEYNLFITK